MGPYGAFLCSVWDEWLRRDVGKVLVNFCETLVVQRMGQPDQICIYAETCGKGVAIEHDGSVYSCDHYVYPQYCRDCSYLADCWGECPKNRIVRTPDGNPGLNYLCPDLKRFFKHARRDADKLAAQLQSVPGNTPPGVRSADAARGRRLPADRLEADILISVLAGSSAAAVIRS